MNTLDRLALLLARLALRALSTIARQPLTLD